MKATFLDLRKRSKEIVKALDRNQTVTLLYRGKAKGMIIPVAGSSKKTMSALDHPAFGIWRNRTDMKNVVKWVDKLRETRHAL